MGTRKFNLTDTQQQHILMEKHVSKKVPHFTLSKDSSCIYLQFLRRISWFLAATAQPH